MKAVFWHSFSHALWPALEEDYSVLLHGFKKNMNAFNIPVVHLTTKDAEGVGDEVYRYKDLDPKNIVLNREIAFLDYLEKAADDVYLFTEPDARLIEMFPPLAGDIALLLRPNDGVPITPSFRLTTRKALPFFRMTREHMLNQRADWHGDSVAWAKAWADIGKPTLFGQHKWNDIVFELREYGQYSSRKSRFITHHKYVTKRDLVAKERGQV